MNKQIIIFEKRAKLMLSKYRFNDEINVNDRLIASAMKNIEDLGYTFDKELIEKLPYMELESFKKFYDETVKMCKKVVGGHVVHQPMYPNFPEQVMHLADAELYINAINHYVFGITPQDVEIERLPLIQNVILKKIGLGDESEFEKIVRNLIAAKTSISESNKKIIEWALVNETEVKKFLPKEIHLKENLAFVMGILTREGKAESELLEKYFKTATDILRYATQLSNGDVSLKENTRFKKFNRKERKLLLGMLNNKKALLDDMLKYQARWVRLGEILHPGEYSKKYSRAFKAFKVVRNHKESGYQTYNSKVEASMLNRDYVTLLGLLSKKPGEFARKLDRILREVDAQSTMLSESVIDEFKKVVDKVSTPVVIQLIGHFEGRNLIDSTTREFFPKGNISKIWMTENKLENLSEKTCGRVLDVCRDELIRRFSELEPLGSVFIDDNLRGCLVPFSERSASKSLKTFSRGSRFDIEEETKFLRMFLHWKQPKDIRIDVDMSVACLDEDFNIKSTVSYMRLRDARLGVYHSGDITSAPNGAVEYIDVDVEKAISEGVRYISMTAHSYNGVPYCDMPECFVGWMEREDNVMGKIFEEKTVKNKIDISANLKVIVPIVFDLVERKVIWVDMGLENEVLYYRMPNNIQKDLKYFGALTKSITKIKKMDLHDLFTLHAIARGKIVESPEEADIIFSREEGITPHDFDIIAGEYLV